MTYRISGLDPATYRHVFHQTDEALAALGVVRMIADSHPGFPCRISLDDAAPGTAMLLVNHVSLHGGPYQASHAIFVTEGAERPAVYEDAVPPALDRRILSVRAIDAKGMMVDARLAQSGKAEIVFRELLANPAVDHLDAHNAIRGCFAARVDRH